MANTVQTAEEFKLKTLGELEFPVKLGEKYGIEVLVNQKPTGQIVKRRVSDGKIMSNQEFEDLGKALLQYNEGLKTEDPLEAYISASIAKNHFHRADLEQKANTRLYYLLTGDKSAERGTIKPLTVEYFVGEYLPNAIDLVHSVLQKSEVKKEDYHPLVIDTLRTQHVLERARGKEDLVVKYINGRLGVEEKKGVKNDYVGLPNKMSDSAKSDIADYEKLKKEVGDSLRSEFGQKEISDGMFTEHIEKYVFRRLSPLFGFVSWKSYKLEESLNSLGNKVCQIFGIGPATRINALVTDLTSTYQKEFNIMPKS